MSGLMPAYILREWNNDSKILSGGKIYFYQSGTYVPKTVYSDFTLSTPLTNPVVLDASGAADIWLGDGAYRVLVTTSTGTQVRPAIDGIVGTGSGTGQGSNASWVTLKIYSDLRAMTSAPDTVYVTGAYAEGDDGAGWFQLLPGSTETDDNGIILVSGSNVYKRVFSGFINPEWYGVKYGVSLDQTEAYQASLLGSVRWNIPVRLTGSVYLSQDTSVPTGAAVQADIGGFFTSTGHVVMTFQTGSRLDGYGVVFGNDVQPVFAAAGICDAIRLSWMGGTDASARWTRFLGANGLYSYTGVVDVDTDVDFDITVQANLALDFSGGAKINVTGAMNLDIGALAFDSPVQIINYTSEAFIGTVNIGSTKIYLEWFGGSPANTGASNAIPFHAACKAKRIDLLSGNLNYIVTNASTFSVSDFVTWNGNGSKITLNQDITVLGIYTNDITLYGTGSITHSSCVARRTVSTIGLLTGPTAAYDRSIITGTVAWLSESNNSILTDVRTLGGTFTESEISSSASITVLSNSYFSNGKIVKSDANSLPMFVLSNDVYYVTLTGVTIDVGSTLFYGTNTNCVVDIVGCKSANNFSSPLSNGYISVNISGSNTALPNTTATKVNGIGCRLFDANPVLRKAGLKVSVPAATITGSLTGWYGAGVGSMSTDGTALIIGSDLTLDTTPWGMNTLRLAPCNSTGSTPNSYNTLMDLVWRYGGQITVDIAYPAGTAADPNTEICVAFVVPKIGSGLLTTMTDHHTLSVMTTVNLSAVNGAVCKNFSNIWGGQVDITVPSILGATSCVDEWGDVTFSKSGDESIPYIPRIVVYNAGTGVIPTGTKLTMVLGAYMPTTMQYQYYWPATHFDIITGSGWQSVMQVPKNLSGLWKTPYSFRSGDANGVQISVTRPDYYVSSVVPPFATDLPVTVWADGTHLVGSYS